MKLQGVKDILLALLSNIRSTLPQAPGTQEHQQMAGLAAAWALRAYRRVNTCCESRLLQV